MTAGIYAILDTVADAIIGGLHLHRHDAAAIRMFTDIASSDGTSINKHPEDYNLICLGLLTEPSSKLPFYHIDNYEEPAVIITGKQYLAVSGPPIGEKHNNNQSAEPATAASGSRPPARARDPRNVALLDQPQSGKAHEGQS